MAGIFGQTVAASGIGVFVDANGQLGTIVSSRRFKDDIIELPDPTDTLTKLEPISFTYKKDIDPTQTPQIGLDADQVAKVNRDLVVYINDQPYAVRYHLIDTMLLKGYQQQHQQILALQQQVQAILQQLNNQNNSSVN